jgi:hypothetical protein
VIGAAEFCKRSEFDHGMFLGLEFGLMCRVHEPPGTSGFMSVSIEPGCSTFTVVIWSLDFSVV